MKRSRLAIAALLGLIAVCAALQLPTTNSHAAGTITISSVSGDFYTNPSPNHPQADSGFTLAGATLEFTQSFPVINFNPPNTVIPCSPGVGARPFTDVVNTSCTGNIPAQGSGFQAGVGALFDFEAVFTGSFTVNGPGAVTFDFYSDDGWIMGIGPSGTNQPTQSSGVNIQPPPDSPVHHYKIVGSYNQPSSPAPQTTVVNFPGAGTYPFEIDYFECCGGALALTLTANGSLIEPPISASGTAISATEGKNFSGQVATFTDSDSNASASEYSANIDWGDGNTSAGSINGSGGNFTITGSHTYADEGGFPVTTTITDVDNPNNGATAMSTAAVAEADSLSGTGTAFSVAEGTAFSGVVATFADSNSANTATDFNASVDWGDGNTSSGTVGGGSGTFTVSASHTYAEDGSYTVTVSLLDDSPGSATASTTTKATVAEVDLTGSGSAVNAVEGAPFSGQVASFSDSGSADPASAFTASIDWGDSSSSTGTVGGSAGSYTVSGTHTYADEGSYKVVTTLTETGIANGSATATGTATVADAALSATGTSISSVEGASTGTVTVATFTDANPNATCADFTASGGSITIDWGDGTPTSSGTCSGSTGGPFTVTGSHTYAEEGTFTITVKIVDDGGSTATATSTTTVKDAPLSASCATPATSLQAFNGSVAKFTDAASPFGTLSDFTATINWGDSNSSAGVVSGPNGGPYTVSGSHTYTSTGNFTITVNIKDVGGSTASMSCTLLIFAFAPGGGSFVIGDQSDTPNASVSFWGAQWAKINSLSGGGAPSSFKGFANAPATPACGTGWSTDPGNSANPPAGPLPAYMAVIVSSGISKSGSTISGNTVHIVIVRTDAGYANDPGHAGKGTIVATVC